jgi:hypothetical protein
MGQLGSVPALGLVVLGPAPIGRTHHRVHPLVIAIPDAETRPALMPTRPRVEALDGSTPMRLLMALIPSNDDDPRPPPARSARALNLSRCGSLERQQHRRDEHRWAVSEANTGIPRSRAAQQAASSDAPGSRRSPTLLISAASAAVRHLVGLLGWDTDSSRR